MGRSYLVYDGQLAVIKVLWWGKLQQLQGGEEGGQQRHLCNRRGGGHHTSSAGSRNTFIKSVLIKIFEYTKLYCWFHGYSKEFNNMLATLNIYLV